MVKSKVKEAKVPLKGEPKKRAPKASETARVKASNLSEEKVLESGSESDSGTSGGGSDTESEDEKRHNTKKPNVDKVAVTEPTEPAVPDDTSSEEEDSEEESDDGQAETTKAATTKAAKAKPTTNGTKRKADESPSGEDESDEELPDAPAAKKARSESEESEDESGADGNDGNKMEVDQPALPPGIIASSVPAQPFEPPPGYVPMDSKSQNIFNSSDLKGKQIWHITAPIDLPISALHEVALDAVQSGKVVMSHKGFDYILSEDKAASASGAAVLLSGKEGYAPVQQPIARTLHFKQDIALPNISDKRADQLTGSNTAGDVATAAVTAIRPQPRGLRMRYRPPGFGAGNPGRIGSESESEAEESQPVGKEAVFQFPKKPEVSGKEKKDKKEKKEKKSKKKS